MLLLPDYYFWIQRPFPSINFVDSALLVLGAGMLLTDMPRWKFTRTDLWMAVFLFTTCYTDYNHERTTDAAFALFASITVGLIPYMAGKLLIEQTGSRISVSKMIVLLLSWSSFVSATEYFTKVNPYNEFWRHLFPGQWTIWKTQIRWGFGRVAGPFAQSELAGMMLFTALLLALWLGRSNYQELASHPPPPTLLQRGKAHIWILAVALFLTQARGPWIGAVLALAIAPIGNAKRPLRRAIIVFTCIVLIGVPTYLFGKDYLAGPRVNSGSEKETAQYRAELISNYTPVAILGGEWGWGAGFPRINGQDSIDNEYLYAWLVQGYVGAVAFLLIVGDTIITLIIKGAKANTVRDRHFALTMLGIFIGIAFTLTTVFLGSQSYELFFLLVGWSQAIREPRAQTSEIRNDEIYRLESDSSVAGVYT